MASARSFNMLYCLLQIGINWLIMAYAGRLRLSGLKCELVKDQPRNHEITKLHIFQCHSWNNYDTFQQQIQIVDGNLTNHVNAPNWLQRHCQCLTTATMTATTRNCSHQPAETATPGLVDRRLWADTRRHWSCSPQRKTITTTPVGQEAWAAKRPQFLYAS